MGLTWRTGGDLSPKGEPYQTIGVDIGVAARFTQNNQKSIAGCDTRTSHPAIAELRKVRHGNFAPCDCLMSHPATLSCCTLRHRAIAPCRFRLSHPATQKPRFRHPRITSSTPLHMKQKVLRVLIPRQVQHPRHTGEDIGTVTRRADRPHHSNSNGARPRADHGHLARCRGLLDADYHTRKTLQSQSSRLRIDPVAVSLGLRVDDEVHIRGLRRPCDDIRTLTLPYHVEIGPIR